MDKGLSEKLLQLQKLHLDEQTKIIIEALEVRLKWKQQELEWLLDEKPFRKSKIEEWEHKVKEKREEIVQVYKDIENEIDFLNK